MIPNHKAKPMTSNQNSVSLTGDGGGGVHSRTIRQCIAFLWLLLALAAPVAAQTAPVMPLVRYQAFDSNGDPVAGAKLYFFSAGTTTPKNTYTTSALAVAHSNPVEADGNGVFAAIYFASGAYKVRLTTSAGVQIWEQDNVTAELVAPTVLEKSTAYSVSTTDGSDVLVKVDASGGAVTIATYTAVGNAGKRITVKKTDTSTNSVTLDPSGTETVDGASTLVLIAQHDAATVVSDGTNWQIVARPPPVPPATVQGRLTLTSGTPITTTDVTAATNVYFTPFGGNQIALYNGASGWSLQTFSETTLSLSGLAADTNFDVFGYLSGGTFTLEAVAWTNGTTRATALTTQNGVYVKSGATARRYLGTFRTTSSVGQTEDSLTKRFLWNYYNRADRVLRLHDTTNSWNYTTATWQSANFAGVANANRVEVVVGVAEELIRLSVLATATNTNGAVFGVSIGEDSTSSPASEVMGAALGTGISFGGAGDAHQVEARLTKTPAVGYHYYQWIEASQASGTTTWYGDNGAGTPSPKSGITGTVRQ